MATTAPEKGGVRVCVFVCVCVRVRMGRGRGGGREQLHGNTGWGCSSVSRPLLSGVRGSLASSARQTGLGEERNRLQKREGARGRERRAERKMAHSKTYSPETAPSTGGAGEGRWHREGVEL